MNPTDIVDIPNLRTDIPEFGPGDTVKVHVRVVEGNRERVQVFQGYVIGRQGDGIREHRSRPSRDRSLGHPCMGHEPLQPAPVDH